MQIHELNQFSGTPGDGDYLAIDNGTETMKVPANEVGTDTTYPAMTQAQAEAGTDNTLRVVAPNVFKPSVLALMRNMIHLETVAATGTVNANTNAVISASYPTVSGYTPIGIIDVRNSAGASIAITEFAILGAVARVVARNLSASSVSVTITMTVLYIPT